MNNLVFVTGLNAKSPKEVFRQIAMQAAGQIGVEPPLFYDALCILHKEDHSGIGRGLAVPQGRLPFLEYPCYVLATLNNAVDFDSLDHMPVDLVFCVLSPEQDVKGHLSRLAHISRLLKDDALCDRVRGCESEDAAKAVLMAEDIPALRAA